jgi:hypothetical protein
MSVPRNLILALALTLASTAAAESPALTEKPVIERIWLTHQTHAPDRIVVSWEGPAEGAAVVEFGNDPALAQRQTGPGSGGIRQVEIPAAPPGEPLYYRIRCGDAVSGVHRVISREEDELRVAVIADTGFAERPWADAVVRERPHLLLSAGDHVEALHQGKPVASEDTSAFGRFVDQAPELFRSTPWMPLLGNHDREIRPRGERPPADAVYDIEATAFRAFFALPGEEWHWHFDVPEFGVRFLALDLSHLTDMGTTWQSCHPYDRQSVQFQWYRRMSEQSRQPFLVTLYNEQNARVRGLEGGDWGRMLLRGSLAITGYGYFAERAQVGAAAFYNTSVNGLETPYPDPKSEVLRREDSFVLLTFRKSTERLRVQLKNLSGATLDEQHFSPRLLPEKSPE